MTQSILVKTYFISQLVHTIQHDNSKRLYGQ